MPTHPPRPYRPDIDGLRGIAILLVVTFHAFPALLPGGFLGVDVFFTISGFLITGIILDHHREPRFLRDFYARRARRLFPALLPVLAAVLAFGFFALYPAEFKRLADHVLAGTAFASNLLLWSEAGYFDKLAQTKPLLHLWSLGVEEQFYLAWPMLFILFLKLKARPWPLVAASALASFVACLLITHHAPSHAFYSPLTRLWELLLGALLALAAQGARPWRPGPWAPSLGLLILTLAVWLVREEAGFPGPHALWPVLGTTLVIAGGHARWWGTPFLTHRGLVGLGLVSYPLYLWHWPLLSYARILHPRELPLPWTWALVLTAVLLAWATYRFVERPVRAAPPRGALVPLLVAGLVLVAALSAGIHLWFPVSPVLFGPPPWRPSLTPWPGPQSLQRLCRHNNDDHHLGCRIGDAHLPPTVALLGDSQAGQFFDAFAQRYAARGENLMALERYTCLPLWGLKYDLPKQKPCPPLMEAALGEAVAARSVHTVVLAHRFQVFYPLAAYAEALRRTLGRLEAANKKVVFVYAIPEMDFDPGRCHEKAFLNQRFLASCSIPRRQHEELQRPVREVVDAVLEDFPRVVRLHADRRLCDARRCWASRGGVMLYHDGLHLGYAGSVRVAEGFFGPETRTTSPAPPPVPGRP